MDYIMAFDVGTSALKAILIDQCGHIRGSAQATYGLIFSKSGQVEVNPADWWQAVTKASRTIMAGTDVPAKNVKGLVFCTQASNIIPIGNDGAVLRPGISWMDSRADEEAAEIMEMLGGPEQAVALLGTEFTGMDVLPKIRWIMKNEPHIFQKLRTTLDCNGYLTYRATGELTFDICSASFLGYDKQAGDVYRDLLALSGLDMDKFPRLVKSYEKIGPLTQAAAEEMGLTRETIVFGGTDDMQGTSIGSGMASEGDAHVYLGTSGWASVVTGDIKGLSNGGGCIMSADPDLYLWTYSTQNCCAAFDWFIDNFYAAEKASPLIPNVYDFVCHLVEQVPAGSGGVLFNPWLSGERSPVQDAFTRGGFLNIGLEHRREHMLRAVMEAVAYNLRWCFESLEADLGTKMQAVRILGGGTRSRVWMQIFADVFGREMEVVKDSQIAGAIGAAYLGAIGLGFCEGFDGAKEWSKLAAVYTPSPGHTALYNDGYARFKESYEAVKQPYRRWNKG
ncbi:MAG: FGGY-family carbohydrate kinase [Christensenellaceae bacterium]|nr:FGGY-family carbohydrate kinase [Christensenellaceae bacterium]